LVNRLAIAKFTALGVMVVLIAGGAIGLYSYTSLPKSNSGSSATSSSHTIGGVGGSQDSSGQPQGTWASYLGYLPNGYQIPPRYSNAASFPCPAGMSSTLCTLFKQTCGNGVCDPNERCDTCAIDCGVTGAQACDPYTGRAGSPTSVCQAIIGANQYG
jgi:hypothetical protein